MATKLLTPVFRVSFPSVFEASSYEGGAPKFSVCAVWEPAKFTALDNVTLITRTNFKEELSKIGLWK